MRITVIEVDDSRERNKLVCDDCGAAEEVLTLLLAITGYYNDITTHQLLDKDVPLSRPVKRTGISSSHPIPGGLYRHYVRV
jgi:hypothetical protein